MIGFDFLVSPWLRKWRAKPKRRKLLSTLNRSNVRNSDFRPALAEKAFLNHLTHPSQWGRPVLFATSLKWFVERTNERTTEQCPHDHPKMNAPIGYKGPLKIILLKGEVLTVSM